jgi:cytochrome c5
MPFDRRERRAEDRRSRRLGTAHRPGQGHAVQGCHGGKGNMPPKGGTTWPDDTIRKVVDYMVSLNK